MLFCHMIENHCQCGCFMTLPISIVWVKSTSILIYGLWNTKYLFVIYNSKYSIMYVLQALSWDLCDQEKIWIGAWLNKLELQLIVISNWNSDNFLNCLPFMSENSEKCLSQLPQTKQTVQNIKFIVIQNKETQQIHKFGGETR